MDPVFTAADIRAAEEVLLAGMPEGALMARAASGLARAAAAELVAARGRVVGAFVVVAAGGGNNGGDALWAAADLLERGAAAVAWRTGRSVHEAGWAAFISAGGREVDAPGAVAALADADLVLDGVLGLGGRGGLPEPVALFAAACGDIGVRVVAVDLPSGLVPDSCVAHPSLAADLTVTFAGRKLCHVAQPAAGRCGRVVVVDIGLDLAPAGIEAWTEADVAAAWPFPDATSDKYSRGVLGIDTGSRHYPGAAVLGCLGATHAGAGMVRYLGPARDAVLAALPNVVTAPGRVQAWLVGSGWGDRGDGVREVVERLDDGLPMVVDADAIALVAHQGLCDRVLLTPHAGELARLLAVPRGEVVADPVGHALAAARTTGAVVLLKGATQYVAEPTGRVRIAVGGPAWTAQAGSGDVLAGICGTLLAAGLAPAEAGLAAASAQALCAAAHRGPLPPQDLVRFLPQRIDQLAVLRRDR